MTNEQKAKEIAENQFSWYSDFDDVNSFEECYESAMEMAKWKDEQEVEFLQSLMFQASTQQALNIIINNRIKLLKGE